MGSKNDQTDEIYVFNNEGINDVKKDATAAITSDSTESSRNAAAAWIEKSDQQTD